LKEFLLLVGLSNYHCKEILWVFILNFIVRINYRICQIKKRRPQKSERSSYRYFYVFLHLE
ncbi:hypothetical protein, partial [Fructobacillus fructosus]|uniref:hypothetical protein n=1 Tax=Fructobacillus fructosus TaxID=1631 RepID=UPI0030C898B8